MYGSWDMVCDRCNCYFSFFGYFLPFYPLNSPKNQNFQKMKKTAGDIIILHKCTKNYDKMVYGSWDMLCDGWTDGRKKWHTEVYAPPKKKHLPLDYFQKQIPGWSLVCLKHRLNHLITKWGSKKEKFVHWQHNFPYWYQFKWYQVTVFPFQNDTDLATHEPNNKYNTIN